MPRKFTTAQTLLLKRLRRYEIDELLGYAASTKQSLIRAGLVQGSEETRYSLTDAGRALLASWRYQ